MAVADAKLADYFQRFIIPLGILYIGLKIFAAIYRKIFPYAYAIVCSRFGKKHHIVIRKYKDTLFADIVNQCKENQRFFALEIGCGPGNNFDVYPPHTSLTLVEPNDRFQKEISVNAAKFSTLEVTKILSMGAEDLAGQVDDASQDAVVSTLTLCSVQNIDAVISEIYRVLKPGGRFYFIDHTRAHAKHSWSHLVQRVLTPIFFAACGCTITTTPWTAVDRAGFSQVQYTKINIMKLPVLFRPHVFGYAVK